MIPGQRCQELCLLSMKKEADNYILAYYQQIKDGRVTVGKWVRMVYERIIRDLEAGVYQFDAKKATSVITFIESKCHHSEGRLAPQTLRLELWQKALLSCIFGLVDADGNRHFREVFIVLARKQGKSLLASAIVEQMIYNDGEYGAKAFLVAPKMDQADLVFSAFWQSVQLDRELSYKTKSRKSDIYVAETNSSVKKIAFNAKKSDGFNPTCVVMDEVAAFPPEQGLKQYEVMASAMGAREQPILLSISTAGYISEGVYDELVKRSTHFLNGESKETRLLPFMYMTDDIAKWNDINELRKSNPNLGVSVSVDYMLEEIAKAEGSLSKKREFLAKYCNQKQTSSMAWLPAEVVNKCFGSPAKVSDFSKTYSVMGIDLSQTRDLTACTTLIERDGDLYVDCHFWLPGGKIDEAIIRDGVPYDIYIEQGFLSPSGDAFIDYRDCYDYVMKRIQEDRILPLMIGYDRYSAQYLVSDLEQAGARLDDVYQGDNLWGVMNELYALMEEGRVHVIGNEKGDDNNLLKMHFLDSAVKMSVERGRGKLVKVNQAVHIDGMASLLDAMAVRSKWYDRLGSQLKNERR